MHLPRRARARGGAPVCDGARGHPRCPQRHRPPVSSLRVRRASPATERRRTPRSPRLHTTCSSRVSASSRHYAVPACIDAGVASVEADYVAALAAVRDGPAKTRGVALGKAAAAAIRALRATDRLTELLVPDFTYPQGTAPGEYRFTPGTPFAFGPRLGEAKPFVLNDGSQFRPGPPHAVTDKRYTADFNEVKRLGGDGVTTPSARTADQTQIALFWVESSPLQWNRIARTASVQRRARPVGERAPVRAAQHGPDGRLHRDLRDQVPLQLLATGHRNPDGGHRRQPRDRRGSDLDAPARTDASDPRL